MNLEHLAHLGEIVGAVAVVVSLVYVGYQIRQNTQSTQAATFQSYVENAMGWMASVYEDAELCELWRQGSTNPENLNEQEQDRYSFMLLAFFRMFENVYLQVEKGTVENAQWEGLRESYLRLIDAAGPRAWWNENSPRYNKSFQELVEHELQRRAA